MARVYDAPGHYELAFSFRDLRKEVRVMEAAMDRFSRLPVATVLEVGCGPAPHLEELLRRRYRYVGLDLSEAMLETVRRKAAAAGGQAETVRGDMARFTLPRRADFAFNALGSMYVPSREAFASHLASMAAALAPGAVYLLDWVLWTWTGPGRDTWEGAATRDGVRMTVTWSADAADPATGTARERLLIEGTDRGVPFRLDQESVKLALAEPEFVAAVGAQGGFEYLGSWNDWNLDQPLASAASVNRPVTLLRRR